MWSKRRYNEIFFMIDTCQAASMYQKFYSPNILAVASSLVGQDSLSHHVDPAIGKRSQIFHQLFSQVNPFICVPGVYIIDRYTYYALEFLEGVERGSKKTMGQFLEVCPQRLCMSTVGNRTDLFARYKTIQAFFFKHCQTTRA